MKLLDIIKKWLGFGKKVDIIRYSDLVQIPDRSFYKDDKEKLDMIDYYKNQYLGILSQRRRLTTRDVSSETLFKNHKMYSDIIRNIVMRENFYDIKKQTKFDNELVITKLNMYKDELIHIEEETKFRLMSLIEIKKEKRVPLLNRKLVDYEIENLKVTLQIILSQKVAIFNEIESYLTHISIIPPVSKDEEVDEFNTKKHDILRDVRLFINPDKFFRSQEFEYTNSRKKMAKQTALLAILERKLEEYIYTHKSIVNELKELVEEVIRTKKFNKLGDDPEHALYNIEYKYNALRKYGRNIITDDDYRQLYYARFLEMERGLLQRGNTDGCYTNALFRYVDGIEKETYENIIFSKREKILKGENPVLGELFGSNQWEVIRILSKHFKDIEASRRKREMEISRNMGEDFNPYDIKYALDYMLNKNLDYSHYEYLDTIRLTLAFDSVKHFNRVANSGCIQRPKTKQVLEEIKAKRIQSPDNKQKEKPMKRQLSFENKAI